MELTGFTLYTCVSCCSVISVYDSAKARRVKGEVT